MKSNHIHLTVTLKRPLSSWRSISGSAIKVETVDSRGGSMWTRRSTHMDTRFM